MTSIIQPQARPVSAPRHNAPSFRSRALNWMLSLDASYREKCRMKKLTNKERLDMGMPLRSDPPRFPNVGW